MYHVLNLSKTHLLKGDELSTECGQLVGKLWRRTLGDESEAIKFRRPRRQMWSPRWEPSLRDLVTTSTLKLNLSFTIFANSLHHWCFQGPTHKPHHPLLLLFRNNLERVHGSNMCSSFLMNWNNLRSLVNPPCKIFTQYNLLWSAVLTLRLNSGNSSYSVFELKKIDWNRSFLILPSSTQMDRLCFGLFYSFIIHLYCNDRIIWFVELNMIQMKDWKTEINRSNTHIY